MTTQTRLLLRAKLTFAERTIVAHTLRVSPRALWIATDDDVATGTAVDVALSFPSVVDEFEVSGRVVARTPARGHGESAFLEVELTAVPDVARSELERLCGPPRSVRGKTFRCLLVEDNAFIRDIFGYAVGRYSKDREAAVELECATDGEHAWRMLREARFDLAIVDEYLPRLNGSQLIERVRALPDLAQFPIVGISVGGAGARDAMLGAGADLFLDKPVVLRDLFETLDRLIVR